MTWNCDQRFQQVSVTARSGEATGKVVLRRGGGVGGSHKNAATLSVKFNHRKKTIKKNYTTDRVIVAFGLKRWLVRVN